ncbi:MAG: hypothetical protein U0174_25015 [Polyangiaceae bacterium]
MTKKTYTPAPEVPTELRARYQQVLEVLSGMTTVSEAARRLGMSRNRFQTLMHRGLQSLLGTLGPQAPGRPARPTREVELEEEVSRLQRENARLHEQAAMTERLMGMAGEFLRGRPMLSRRESKPKKAKTEAGAKSKEEEEHERRTFFMARTKDLACAGLPVSRVANVMGVSVRTIHRWEQESASRARRKPRPALPLSVKEEVASKVRALHGLIGAEALRHAVVGVSRRQAAAIKRETLVLMERERIDEATHIQVTEPGIVRGFDAMELPSCEGRRWLLVSADACVPFRTSAPLVERYDSEAVANALRQDFELHGPPLVLRFDRASAHKTPEVRAVLDEYEVLLLHGPPRYPRYYGQLERQNREHRAWLEHLGATSSRALEHHRDNMLLALNTAWPRRKLGWRTPSEVWKTRTTERFNRRQLRTEVRRKAARLLAKHDRKIMSRDLADRLAIEHTLARRGLVRRNSGMRC